MHKPPNNLESERLPSCKTNLQSMGLLQSKSSEPELRDADRNTVSANSLLRTSSLESCLVLVGTLNPERYNLTITDSIYLLYLNSQSKLRDSLGFRRQATPP